MFIVVSSLQNVRIDAPVLIDLKHGSIRYRYLEEDSKASKRKEHPHEGDEKQKKGHYFYHPRLNEFGESKKTKLLLFE